MKPSVYVETSIFSVLTARPSKNLMLAGRQQTTRIWWQNDADAFTLITSELVQWEAAKGDPEMVRLRLEYVESLPRLSSTGLAYDLANGLIAARILPPKALADAIHFCTATVHNIPYILTWNFKHMANVQIFPRVLRHLMEMGYNPSYMSTPDALSKVTHA